MAVEIIQIPNREEWNKFRMTNGVGASECATILGYNQYQSAAEIFHRKIGFDLYEFASIRALYGVATESLSSHIWEHWKDDIETTTMNLRDKKKIRECRKFEEFDIQINSDVPFLYSSPDRETLQPNRTSIEIKDSSSMALNVWKSGIPIAYEIQNRVQMMVGEYGYGELFFIIDGGRDCKLYPLVRNGIIVDNITEQDLKRKAAEFWQKVLAGREASEIGRQAKKEGDHKTAEECAAMIMQLEPEPDMNLCYEKFMNEKYLPLATPQIQIKGTEKDEALAEEYLKQKEKVKREEDIFQGVRNKVIARCKAGARINLTGKHFIQVTQGKTTAKITVK